jgi:hypothetical protein
MLRARHATERVAAAAQAAGVTLRGRCRVEAVEGGTVTLDDGTRLVADQVLLATGSWTSGLWDAAPIVATRQLTLYLDVDPGPLPIFGEGAPFSHYGFPAHDGLGFKVGSHVTGAPGDPADEAARTALAAEVDGIRAYAARRFPATAGAPCRARRLLLRHDADGRPGRRPARRSHGRLRRLLGARLQVRPGGGPGGRELVLGREPSVDVRPFAVPTASRCPRREPTMGTAAGGIRIVPAEHDHLAAAAELLAARQRRAVAVEPLLPAEFTEPAGARRVLDAAWAADARGAVALRGEDLVGVMLGTIGVDPVRGRVAWSRYGWHAIAEDLPDGGELYRDLYAAVSPAWVDGGHFEHLVVVPAADGAALAAFAALGFGHQQAHAVRETDADDAPVERPAGVEIRRAGPATSISS